MNDNFGDDCVHFYAPGRQIHCNKVFLETTNTGLAVFLTQHE